MFTSPWHVLFATLIISAAALFIRERRRQKALPLADTVRYARGSSARWTVLVYGIFALMIMVFLSLAVFASAKEDQFRERFSIPDTNGIIVLDVSGSMDEHHKEIADTLNRIASDYGKGRRFGFLVFSDTAYALHAVNVNADELRNIVVRFQEARRATGFEDRNFRGGFVLVSNPLELFSGGTDISSGLMLARRMFQRAGIEGGTVILISDLVDSGVSEGKIGRLLLDYLKEGRNLRVIGLGASGEDKTTYRRLLGNKAFVLNADEFATLHGAPKQISDVSVGSFLLFVLLVLCIVVLAFNERRTTELDWDEKNNQRR